MDGLENVPFFALGACFALAFAVEIALNRSPWIVGLATPIGAYLLLLIVLAVVFGRVSGDDAFLLAVMFGLAPLGSLAGAGSARGLRWWLDYRREQSRLGD